MDNQLQSLSKLFSERLFRIPDYQRGYAWGEKELQDFWNDVSQLPDGRNHYTGVLTLEQAPHAAVASWTDDLWIIESKNYTPTYVVDGQQRLTTAIVLLQVILERAKPKDKLNFTNRADIQRKFIFDSKDDGISRSYLFGYERDNPSYEFLKTKIFGEHSSAAASQEKETIYTHNLEYAKTFFRSRVQFLKWLEVERLYRKVTQNLLFNIFTITDDVDVCVAFETMNNRGKRLSVLELLKNRLIYLSLQFDAPDFERAQLRRAINDCWRSIYHNLGRNKARPLDDDQFLWNHFVSYFGKDALEVHNHRYSNAGYVHYLLEVKFITKNVHVDTPAKDKVTLPDIHKYVTSLQVSVDLWYQLFNPHDSDFASEVRIWLDKLNRLEMDRVAALLVVFFQKEKSDEKRIALLQTVERKLFVMSLLDYRYLGVDVDRFIEAAVGLAGRKGNVDETLREVTGDTERIVNEICRRGLFQDRFRENGFYEWSRIRYFLFEYNLWLQERSKTSRPKILWPEFVEQRNDFISVEHIYPQTPRHQYWKTRFGKYSQSQRKALTDSLGNLLPLSKPKNSALQNRPFPEKVAGLGEGDTVAYRYGSYAENEVSALTDWDAVQIARRGLRLLDFMESRWRITFGTHKDKLRMLNCEAVAKREKVTL